MYFRFKLFYVSAVKNILSAAVAQKKLNRMALEIAERNYNEPEIVLLGIKEQGTVIAQKIAAGLSAVFKGNISVLDLHIDKKKPGNVTITPDADFNNKTVILVDDVANSGRTMLYALKPLLNQHPKKIQTLALVERTHKTFPVEVDYVGLSVSTNPNEHIYVDVENGEVAGARMVSEN
jgi:pyrimidine operon attenuation protein/uracil phosphoribosyltransferase